MKRVLFWAVVMFALGEVIYIMVGETVLSCVLIGTLICVGVFLGKTQKRMAYIWVCFMSMAGFINMGSRCGCDRLEKLVKRECEGEDTYIELQGTVDEVNKTKSGCNIIIKSDDKCRIIVYGVDSELKAGQEVFVAGNTICPSAPTNPGAFDFAAYYRAKGICFSVAVDKLTVTDASYRKGWELLENIREWGIQRLEEICTSGCAEYKGILFGDKSSISDRSMLIFRRSGIAHILAISGLHISIISGCVYVILRKLYIPTWISSLTAIMAAFLYGTLAGFSMSTMRALIMLMVAMLGERLGKSFDMLTGLAAAVLIMLIINPMSITDTGMLLSIGAICGVCLGTYINREILYYGKIKNFYKKHKAAKYAIGSVVVSMSINMVTLPIVANAYYEVSVYSILVNLLVVPCMSIVVTLGFGGILLSVCSLPLGKAVIAVGGWLLRLFKEIAAFTLKLPFSTINTGRPLAWQVIVYYMILLAILAITDRHMKEKLIWFLENKRFKHVNRKRFALFQHVAVIAVLCIAVGITICFYSVKRLERFVFLDVGQGDGILVSSPRGMVLAIDGGSSSMEGENVGKYVLAPAIKSLKMADVDFWAVTHGDMDHVNGLISILENYDVYGIKIRCILFSRHVVYNEAIDKIITLANENKISVSYLEAGDMVTDGSADIVCCHPDSSFDTSDTNDASLGLSYQGDTLSGLFLGDMSGDAIQYMFIHHTGLLQNSYRCVKVPHHGSKNSMYGALYTDNKVKMAVISCGKNNLYGHPHNEIINMLKEEGIDIYRTDKHGAVIVR